MIPGPQNGLFWDPDPKIWSLGSQDLEIWTSGFETPDPKLTHFGPHFGGLEVTTSGRRPNNRRRRPARPNEACTGL